MNGNTYAGEVRDVYEADIRINYVVGSGEVAERVHISDSNVTLRTITLAESITAGPVHRL